MSRWPRPRRAANDRARAEGGRPAQPRQQPLRETRRRDRARDDQPDGEQQNRAQIEAEQGPVGGPAAAEQQRRQDREEDEIRRDAHGRQAGTKASAVPASTNTIEYGSASRLATIANAIAAAKPRTSKTGSVTPSLRRSASDGYLGSVHVTTA